MATNDITFFEPGAFGVIGTRRYQVQYGSGANINPGEPVYTTPNSPYVYPMPTNSPTLAQGYIVGVAQSTSTNTSTAPGVVDVFPAIQGVVYYVAPNTAATYGLTPGSTNQTTYNLLVGKRVLFDLTSSTYTILATDNAANGLVVEYCDVTKSSGKVAFSFRNGFTYLTAATV